MITNNVYLDGITHRRMRECLLNTFNEIYVLNLHGNLRKKETCPDGSKDKNVFQIQLGVAITLFIKIPDSKGCRIFYYDLWGQREAKYSWLHEQSVVCKDFQALAPAKPYYFFVPKDFKLTDEYFKGPSLTDIFHTNGNGIKTDRDALFFGESREEVAGRMRTLFSPSGIEEPFKSKYKVENSSSYPLLERRSANTFNEQSIYQCLYRPFDVRWLYYSVGITSRPAWEVMQHMLPKGSLGLLAMRQYEYDVPEYCYFLATRILTECRIFVSNRGIANCFPLYLATSLKTHDNGSSVRIPNLNAVFLRALAEKLALSCEGPYGLPKGVAPEDIFNYAYAIFHSPIYRKRYVYFLKIDYPRLPLTGNLQLFRSLAAKGAKLVALHLLEAPEINNPITGFSEKGDNIVDKVQYSDENNRAWINKAQYFSEVSKSIWEFRIGGYKVCDTWLKARKGQKLLYDDIEQFRKIIVALNPNPGLTSGESSRACFACPSPSEPTPSTDLRPGICGGTLNKTISLMSEIDSIIPSWPIT
jgi:predicted helicase